MQIDWTAEDSVGIESIDDQHKRLVDMTNRLFKAIMDDHGIPQAKELLEELAEYVAEHFTYEEKLLAQHGYPRDLLIEHVEEHRKWTQRIYDFMVKYNADDPTVDIELYDMLREWVTDHLHVTDMKYTEFLQEKGVQ